MRINNLSIAIVIPDLDYGGEEKRVIFFANNYTRYFKKVFLISPLGQSISQLNSEVQHINLNIRNPKNILNFVSIIRRNQIDFVQGHKRMTLPYLYASEKFTQAKSVFNFDNIYLQFNWHCKFIMPNNIVYLSDVLLDFYVSYYPDKNNKTINMGGDFLAKIDENSVNNIRQKLELPNAFVMLSLGRLSEQKNHKLLLSSLAHLKAYNFVCLIAGTGPLEKELKTLATALNIEDKVRFLGHRTDVEDLLNIADLLVQTSIFEGFPNVFIEAASVGIPIVSTDVGSSKSIIQKNGLLVESGNLEALTSALKAALTNLDVLKRDASEYMLSAELQKFRKENMLSNYLEYYENF